jgi:type IV secretion system protein VirB2
MSRIILALAVVAVILVVSPDMAHAGGATAMPWDSNLKKISDSFTGPLAYGLAIIGCVACGATLIFAQEIPFFLRGVVFVVLAASFMMGANAVASAMGWTGALVG